jgi:hypothetical protein
MSYIHTDRFYVKGLVALVTGGKPPSFTDVADDTLMSAEKHIYDPRLTSTMRLRRS